MKIVTTIFPTFALLLLFCEITLAAPVGSAASYSKITLPTTISIGRGTQNYKPYHWLEDNHVTGFTPDLIRAVIEPMGIEVLFIQGLPWKRLLRAAKRGELDAIMPLYRTAERSEYLDFSEEPLATEKLVFFTQKKHAISYSGKISAMLAYDIGTIRGYSYGSEFDSLDFKKIEVGTETKLFRMFKAGRFKLGITDHRVLNYYAEELNFPYLVLNPTVTEETLHLGFSSVKGMKKFSELFSRELIKFKKTQAYTNLLKQYGMAIH